MSVVSAKAVAVLDDIGVVAGAAEPSAPEEGEAALSGEADSAEGDADADGVEAPFAQDAKPSTKSATSIHIMMDVDQKK